MALRKTSALTTPTSLIFMIQTMSPFPTSSSAVPFGQALAISPLRPTVSWSAIFAGLAAALALQVLFMMLGAGLGFAIYTPLTDENPIADLGTGAVVVQGVSAVFSLWFGGWIAGRFAPLGARFAGWLHGFIVWSAATVAGVLVVSGGAGWALGDLSKLVGGGLSLAGQPLAAAAGGATDVAKDALKQSSDSIASFVDEAAGHVSQNSNPGGAIRAKREVGLAAARLFTPVGQSNPAENRAALVKALTDTASMNQTEADRMVTEWSASYDRLKADLTAAKNAAETKAREAADKAANALSIFSLCAFLAFALGAGAAACGGHLGAKVARRHTTPTDATI
mgnify:FL=1